MGLLDDVMNAATGGGNQSNSMLGHVLDMVQNHPGGVSGLVNSLNSGGLGAAVSSWIGTGQNMPVSADAIESALGSGPIANLAAKAGISPDQAKTAISQYLPQIIDKISPNGQMPQGGGLLESALSMLRPK
jgi:uncharacterized protein YidB (DUF937 family)